MKTLRSFWWLSLVMLAVIILSVLYIPARFREFSIPGTTTNYAWVPPGFQAIPATAEGDLVRYGHELISRTSMYFGPRGKLSPMANGMNCQNCHLEGGTRYMGNNYSAVYANYPKFRARSGSIEDMNKRISDCFERSLHGQPPDSNSCEMRAIKAYFKWLGGDVPKKISPLGSGIASLNFLDRAASPASGEKIFQQKCVSCHGEDGQGQVATDSSGSYIYPPLWGAHSFTTGAGLFRISRMAGYVRYNMPFDAKPEDRLSDEQSWDVAAFIISQPRPAFNNTGDWPDIRKKPFDHPFGPYSDSFPALQHKYGPFEPIVKAYTSR